jgi:zinc transport system substrate-binding protein
MLIIKTYILITLNRIVRQISEVLITLISAVLLFSLITTITLSFASSTVVAAATTSNSIMRSGNLTKNNTSSETPNTGSSKNPNSFHPPNAGQQQIARQQNVSQGKISVVASFFPIYEFVKAVGGNRIEASTLVPIGAEPHDFDPTIQQIQKANAAKLLVYNGASMEEPWIHELSPQNTIDTSKGITLLPNPSDPQIKGPNDPHIWLDPVLAIQQVQNIRAGLDKADPKNSQYYDQNAQDFIGQLNKLDTAFRGNLSSSNCAKKDFIAFHQAFGYFANQYGLTQHSIHEGLTPNGEVLPQKLVEVVTLASNLGLKVIYSEDLIDPRSAQSIAEQVPGAKVVVLSPIEGVKPSELNAGIGYLDKMYQDLAALKEGLQCRR